MTVVQQMASPIKVGMVLDQPFPPDARVEREAVALVQAGYQVHLLCLATPETRGLDSVYRGIYIHRVNPADVTAQLMGVKHRLPYQGLAKAWQWNQYHIDSVWHALISRFVDRLGLDVLHIHDLKLMHTGLAVADKRGIPVVGDLHENYPALMTLLKGKQANGQPDLKKASQVKSRWEHIEKLACWQADRLLVVTKEAKDRLVANGIAAPKITIVPNTVDGNKFAQVPLDTQVQRQYKHTFLLTYVGHVNGPHRGIETVLQAINLLKWDIPELKFVAAGAVREPYEPVLRQQIEAMELDRFVDFTGWMDEAEFGSYIAAADVCICPHLANDHTNATFPNKLYLYHWYGRPVVASNCLPIERYLTETQGGLVFDSGNAEQLATAIWQLYQNAALRKQLGEQGRSAVLKEHNWQAQAPHFVAMYDDLMNIERVEAGQTTQSAFAPDIGYLLHSEIYPT